MVSSAYFANVNNNGNANYNNATNENGVRPDFTSAHYGLDSPRGNGKGKAVRSGEDPMNDNCDGPGYDRWAYSAVHEAT